MREGTFKINEKGYPERFHGTEVKYQQGTTVAEVVATGHAENEAAVVRAFYNAFNIRSSGLIKKAVALEATTVTDLAAILQGYKVMEEKQAGGGGGNPEALAKARAAREEQKHQAALFKAVEARAAKDPRVAKMLAEIAALQAAD